MAEFDLVGIVDIVSEDIAEVSREIKAIKISGKVETSDSERLCISDDGLIVNRDLAVTYDWVDEPKNGVCRLTLGDHEFEIGVVDAKECSEADGEAEANPSEPPL